MLETKTIGFVRCPVRDILVLYLAQQAGAAKITEVALEVTSGKAKHFRFCFLRQN
jgi:hypothetical protein